MPAPNNFVGPLPIAFHSQYDSSLLITYSEPYAVSLYVLAYDPGQTITEVKFDITQDTAGSDIKSTYGFIWAESHSAGLYTYIGNINNLREKVYYYRVSLTNPDGTTTTDWQSFAMPKSNYAININGIDRTGDVYNQQVLIEDNVNQKVNTATIKLTNLSGHGIPNANDPIDIISPLNVLGSTNIEYLFSGTIQSIELTQAGHGEVVATLLCVDHTVELDKALIRRTYENMTDKEIIEDIVERFAPGAGFTTNQVEEGPTIDKITFKYVQPSKAIEKIAKLTGRYWYIDYNRNIVYREKTSFTNYELDSNTNNYKNLKIKKDLSQIKNRVYVRGGQKLSDFTDYETVGNGVSRRFVLPDKPSDVTVYVNDVQKTVGVKNIDTSGYDYYLNFQEKYIEQDSNASVLTSSDELKITYKYYIPILVAIEDTDSINEYGVREFAIFDKTIETTQSARDRATAELIDYADKLIEGSFTLKNWGSRVASGRKFTIDLPEYGIDDEYVVQKVQHRSMGGGNYETTVHIASAKTVGIINFLISMLENNKNQLEISDDEVLDELLTLQDSLQTDSILDSLVVDSFSTTFVWWDDVLGENNNKLRWDFGQWS